MTDGRTPVDFRIYHPFEHDRSAFGGVRYRAGFEDWSSQEVFVVQLEEAAGYDDDREAVDWSPIARFDHGRPHDVFSAADGLHLDLHRRQDPKTITSTSTSGHTSVPGTPWPRSLVYRKCSGTTTTGRTSSTTSVTSTGSILQFSGCDPARYRS